MCDMKCHSCGYCTMLHKITWGRVSEDKLKYCQLHEMWVSDVILNYKRGLLN